MIKAKDVMLFFLLCFVFFYNKAISQEIKTLQKGGWIVAGSFNFYTGYKAPKLKPFDGMSFDLKGSVGYFFRADYVLGLKIANQDVSLMSANFNTKNGVAYYYFGAGPFIRVYSEISKKGKVFIGGLIDFSDYYTNAQQNRNTYTLVTTGVFNGGFVYFINNKIGIENTINYTTKSFQSTNGNSFLLFGSGGALSLNVGFLYYFVKQNK